MAAGRFPDGASREAFWREHLAGWASSGQSIIGYCRAQGLSEGCFHYWKNEVKRRDGGGRPRSAGGLAFAEVRVAQTNGDEALIDIVLSGARRVRVHRGFDEDTLARVVAVLERAGC